MFLLKKPSAEVVREFIASQIDLPFSYAEVGATQNQPPAGYNVDHNRIKLGSGAVVFERAVAAVKRWQHFDLGWVKIVPEMPIEPGVIVAIRARTFGIWSLSACRIVYVTNDDEPIKRFGFAYGTLPGHVERGEERFTVEWLRDNTVWYDILAFSRPQHPLVKAGFPLARALQKRFAQDSLLAMRSVCGEASNEQLT